MLVSIVVGLRVAPSIPERCDRDVSEIDREVDLALGSDLSRRLRIGGGP
jgi:hypothetical protein